MKYKSKKVLRTGCIGLGFGLNHARIFKKNKFCNLVSICDKKKKYKKHADLLNCEFTLNPKKMSLYSEKKNLIIKKSPYI